MQRTTRYLVALTAIATLTACGTVAVGGSGSDESSCVPRCIGNQPIGCDGDDEVMGTPCATGTMCNLGVCIPEGADVTDGDVHDVSSPPDAGPQSDATPTPDATPDDDIVAPAPDVTPDDDIVVPAPDTTPDDDIVVPTPDATPDDDAATPDDDVCTPAVEDTGAWTQCGDDGCGGSLGECTGGQVCVAGTCECVETTDTACFDGHVYTLDSCGEPTTVAEECGHGCEDAACAPCVPTCEAQQAECGDDGCGGDCGTCDADKTCLDGTCECTETTNTTCVDDDAYYLDSCGEATDALAAECENGCAAGQCLACEPDCSQVACGGDGCGGTCATCPGDQDECIDGQCVCQPLVACDANVTCGEIDDGCDGTVNCGSCANNEVCDEGSCVCVPLSVCAPQSCGDFDDGCDGTLSCGTCAGAQDTCEQGQCVCQPACTGIQCGGDGCGGICGTCAGAQDACEQGQCVCQPACAGIQCGGDGCGGECGTCAPSLQCSGAGQCVICVADDDCSSPQQPVCSDDNVCVQCADDEDCSPLGGGLFGLSICAPNNVCVECVEDEHCAAPATCSNTNQCECVPDCAGKSCGDDGCGGTCGACPLTCEGNGLSTPNGYGVCGCSPEGLCEAGPPPEVVINEIDIDLQSGSFPISETAEFVELRNMGDSTLSEAFVNALFIFNFGVTGQSVTHAVANTGISAWPPGQYRVLGGFSTSAPEGVPLWAGGASIWPNSNRCFALLFGDPNSDDAVLVDAVCHDTSIPSVFGIPDWWAPEGNAGAGTDAGSNSSLARCPNGADTDDNAADFTVSDDPTPGAANNCGGGNKPDNNVPDS